MRYIVPPMKTSTFYIALAFAVAILCDGCSRTPYAKATFEFGAANNAADEQAIRALLPKNDPSVTLLKVRNTGLYEIGVHDSDPRLAAQRANDLAAMLQTKLSAANPDKRFKLWERAEPPIAPKP
jgi:hypothetical protein